MVVVAWILGFVLGFLFGVASFILLLQQRVVSGEALELEQDKFYRIVPVSLPKDPPKQKHEDNYTVCYGNKKASKRLGR